MLSCLCSSARLYLHMIMSEIADDASGTVSARYFWSSLRNVDYVVTKSFCIPMFLVLLSCSGWYIYLFKKVLSPHVHHMV